MGGALLLNGRKPLKAVFVRKDVWERLHILKVRLGKKNMSEVIDELLKVYEAHGHE